MHFWNNTIFKRVMHKTIPEPADRIQMGSVAIMQSAIQSASQTVRSATNISLYFIRSFNALVATNYLTQ